MKTKQLLLSFCSLFIFGTAFQSCTSDDDNNYQNYYPNALVTVKSENNKTYFQLDSKTTLFPVNFNKELFGGKEVRALVNISKVDSIVKPYTQAVRVNWMDTILTKKAIPFKEGEDLDKLYGNDPVEIVKDWITIAEDGYLTLRFRTLWGNKTAHKLNLITGVNKEDPYEVAFHQDAEGDTYGQWADGLVAFKIDDLPDTKGDTVSLKLKWKSFDGDKSTEFKYCTNKTTETSRNFFSSKPQLKVK